MGTNRSSHAIACIIAALLPLAGARAQSFEIAVGPAQRQLDVPSFYGPSAAWDAKAVRATWTGRISPRTRLVLGAGALGGPSIVEEYAIPSFAPCLPTSNCPPPIRHTVLSGSLVHAPRGWFTVGHQSGGAEYSVLLLLCFLLTASTARRAVPAELELPSPDPPHRAQRLARARAARARFRGGMVRRQRRRAGRAFVRRGRALRRGLLRGPAAATVRARAG